MQRASWRPCALVPTGGSVGACQQMSSTDWNKTRETMRIKDVRQGLHALQKTQDVDGLLHLYQRLETRGRVLLLCLLCAQAGWQILVNAWLRLDRASLNWGLLLRA